MNVGTVASLQSATQEALETAAQTKAEAAKGDQQAVRKLARQEAVNNTQSPQQAPNAANSLLDVKA